MISKEHYFSESILKEFFPKPLSIEGCSFKSASRKSLCSKILCRYHNSSLSSLDDNALFFFRLIRRISANTEKSTVHSINGKTFERWLLKLVLGLNAAKLIRQNFTKEQHNILVEILFGLQEWPENTGMYFVFHKSSFEIDTSIGAELISDSCFIVRICNLNFAIVLKDGGLEILHPTQVLRREASMLLCADL